MLRLWRTLFLLIFFLFLDILFQSHNPKFLSYNANLNILLLLFQISHIKSHSILYSLTLSSLLSIDSSSFRQQRHFQIEQTLKTYRKQQQQSISRCFKSEVSAPQTTDDDCLTRLRSHSLPSVHVLHILHIMPSCSCAWLCPALESLLFRADFIYVTLHLIFILTSFRILPIGIWFGSSDSIPRVWLAPGRASDSTELLAPVDHLRFNIQWTIVLWSFFLYPAILSDNLFVRCHVQKNGQDQRQSRGWPQIFSLLCPIVFLLLTDL